MRVLLRLLAPLLGLGLAAVGLLLVIEVVAAWVRPAAGRGLAGAVAATGAACWRTCPGTSPRCR